MSSNQNNFGWQTTEYRDSFVLCPLSGLAQADRELVRNNMNGYHFIFAQTMQKNRPENVHILLPPFLAKQPLHIFCATVVDFDDNSMTLLEAIDQDRSKARAELKDLPLTDKTGIKQSQEFLFNLDLIEKISKGGQEIPLDQEVKPWVPDVINNAGGMRYFSYTHDGFRPLR